MSSMIQFRSHSYNLGPITRIPLGEGRTFQIGDTAVAVFHARGRKVFATQALCPHQAAPLADSIVGAGRLVCPLHGRQFDLASGQPIGHECQPLRTYSVSLTETGDVLLRMDSQDLDSTAALCPISEERALSA